MNRTLRFSCQALTCLLCVAFAPSECVSNEDTDLITWGELRIVIKDEAGKPVTGAVVKAYAMRMIEHDGHMFWNEEKHGAIKNYLTAQDGLVIVRYPSKSVFGPIVLTTKSVSFLVRHSDYVQKVVHFDLALDVDEPIEQADVELKKGCELQLSAVDENGAQVSDFGVMMAGPFAPEFWADDGNGGRRTSALSDGTWQTMLVKPQRDGPTLFSGLLPLRVRPSQALRMRNVKLSPGARIVGRLSSNVPRPVVGGYVSTTSVPKPEGDSWEEHAPSLTWADSVPITADGKFDLPSVPRSGVIQIIAVCDGWVSKTTIPESYFVMGQLFNVSGTQVDVTLEMEQTGSLELLIVKPDGTPLESGEVSGWPNQKTYKGGSTYLGERFYSIKSVQNQFFPVDQQVPPYEGEINHPFIDQPVVNGVAVLRGLPIGKNEQCNLQHKEFRFPNEANDREGSFRFKLESAEPKKVTITVIPHAKADKAP